MSLIKEFIYRFLLLMHDKSAVYKPRSEIPRHEIEAIVSTFYPAVVAFFESVEGKRDFEEWKAKKEKEKHDKKVSA